MPVHIDEIDNIRAEMRRKRILCNVNTLIAIIDSRIIAMGGPCSITFKEEIFGLEYDYLSIQDVQDELRKQYQSAGWDIEFTHIEPRFFLLDRKYVVKLSRKSTEPEL
jgi:hypothetical protein